MLTRNSRRALAETIDNEDSPAKRRRVDQGSKRTAVKREMTESTENKRKVKDSQNAENCNPGPSTSRTKILPRHSRQALSERINDKDSQEKKPKVVRAYKKNLVKKEISKPLENEINIKTSPPKRRRVDRATKKTVLKNEISEPLDKLNIKTSSSTDRVNTSPQINIDVNENNPDIDNSKIASKESTKCFQTPADKINQASEKVGVKKKISVLRPNEINQEYTNNVENCFQVPSTSKSNYTEINTDDKKEILPLSSDTKEDKHNIGNEALLNLEEALPENDDSIVELNVPKKVFEEVSLSDDDEEGQAQTMNQVTTTMDDTVKNIQGPSTSKDNYTKIDTTNDDSIVELEVPKKVFEEVSLSDDDEEGQIQSLNRVKTTVDGMVKLSSGYSSNTSQISADTEGSNLNIGAEALLNIEDAIADNDDSIVELDVPKKVFEEVSLSDDEDGQAQTMNRATTTVDDTVKLSSGSSGSTSQTGTSASCSSNIDIIKIEDSPLYSTITPKNKKKLVLDPSILTPPTGSLQENAAKYWKCLQFLEQSELNPEANEFVPSPKPVAKQAADIQPTDCIICLEPRESTFVNLPCRHAVTCGPCSDQLELLGKDCPVCRTPIETRFQIYN